MESIKKAVGERVREARKKAGFTSADALAERMKISATSVYEIERGENWISPEMLKNLCLALKVEPWVFFSDAPPASPTLESLTAIIAAQEKRIQELESAEPPVKEKNLLTGFDSNKSAARLEIEAMLDKCPEAGLRTVLASIRGVIKAHCPQGQKTSEPVQQQKKTLRR
jgi:transcriptional regulator with XRE-family HTH domain